MQDDHVVPQIIESCLLNLQECGFIKLVKDQDNQPVIDTNEQLTQFNSMNIMPDQYFNSNQGPLKGNTIKSNVECTNLKYYLSLMSYGLSSWSFLENLLLQTCGIEKVQEVQ